MSGQNSMPCSPENQSMLVAGKKRIRSTSVCVWLSPDEQAKIRERMTDVGIRNLSAYMRKMALNGYVLHVDLAPVKEIVSLQRRCADNLNQIAVRANTHGGVYPDEIKTLQKDYTDLWGPSPNCWKGFRRWWRCKRIRPRSGSDGAADREASGHGVQRLPAGLGHPNKHFCEAKIASVIHLPCLPLIMRSEVCFFRPIRTFHPKWA